MYIKRQNPNGGHPITRFSLSFDSDSYTWGHQIGFCANCNEPQLLRTRDAADLVKVFGEEIPLKLEAVAGAMKPKLSLKQKLIELLGGINGS